MKRLATAALLVAAFFTAFTTPTAAQIAPSGRTIVYPLENPPTSDTTLQPARFQRLNLGSFLADGFALTTGGSGLYANCTTAPSTGLFVTIAPTVSGGLCSLYQLTADDANPIPVGYTPQLASDPTLVVIHAMQSVTSGAIGPLTPPVSNSVYWLVEAQIATTDVNQQSRTFILPSGTTQQNVPIQRQDAIVYQTKEGTPGASPTKPAVDSGWVAVAYALVPSGTVTITSGMLSAGAQFSGFGGGGGGSVNSVSGSAPISSSGGANPIITCTPCLTTAGGQSVAGTTTWSGLTPFNFSSVNGVDFTNAATGAQVAWIYNANNSPATDIADWQKNGSNVLQILNSGGVLSQGAFSSASTAPLTFTNTTAATIASAVMGSADAVDINATASPFTGNLLALQKNGTTQWSVNATGVTTEQGINFNATTGSNITSNSTSGGAFNLNAAGGTAGHLWNLEKVGITLSYFDNVGNLVAPGITDSGITSGQCVQTSTGGLFVGTGSACGSGGGGGGVASVSGTPPIVSSGGTTPAISCPTCVTTAGGQSIAGTTTLNTLALTNVLSKANGGNGTATPAITGSGCNTVTGSWPAQNVSGNANCVNTNFATTGNTSLATGTVANTYVQLGSNVSITTGTSNGTNGNWLVTVEEYLSSSNVSVTGGAYGCISSASTFTLKDNTTEGANTCVTALTNSIAGTTSFASPTISYLGSSNATARAVVTVPNSTTFTASCWGAMGSTTSATLSGYCHITAVPE